MSGTALLSGADVAEPASATAAVSSAVSDEVGGWLGGYEPAPSFVGLRAPGSLRRWLAPLVQRLLETEELAGRRDLPLAVAHELDRLLLEAPPPGERMRAVVSHDDVVEVLPDTEVASSTAEFVRNLAVGQNPVVPGEVANRAVQLLVDLRQAARDLPTPTVGPGPDGVLGMTWETNAQHLNLEVFPDGHLELFHEDLRTGELWSDEEATEVPGCFLDQLRRAFPRG